MEIMFNVLLPAKLKKEGKYYVSLCPVLDVASQGITEKDAMGNLREAVQLFLVTCYEMGTLQKVLEDCGFKPMPQLKAGKRRTAYSGRRINVRIPFAAPAKGRRTHCHA